MIDKIATFFIFAISFVMVTALFAFMNLKYDDIFNFNFTPSHIAAELRTQQQIDDMKANLSPEIKNTVFDSLRAIGFDSLSIVQTNNKVVLLEDSIGVLQNEIAQLTRETSQLRATNTKTEKKIDKKTEYQEWIKTTAKLYESMDAQKAAKVILNYSDNIARDILLSMKRKNAADVLEELNPVTATRIMREP